MNSDILMFVMLILFKLIVISLALAIFSSIFIQNRKKGLLFLAAIALFSTYSIYNGYQFSVAMGSGILFLYVSLGVVTYFALKKRHERR